MVVSSLPAHRLCNNPGIALFAGDLTILWVLLLLFCRPRSLARVY